MIHPITAFSDDRLLRRVHGEFMEMPGLRLTVAQACRLWNVDATTSLDVLNHLVDEQFLRVSGSHYVSRSGTRTRPRLTGLHFGSVSLIIVPPVVGHVSISVPPWLSAVRRAMARPSPPPRAFVVKNGSKTCVAQLGRDAGTVVAHVDDSHAVVTLGSLDGDAAVPAHRLAGVEEQVEQRRRAPCRRRRWREHGVAVDAECRAPDLTDRVAPSRSPPAR